MQTKVVRHSRKSVMRSALKATSAPTVGVHKEREEPCATGEFSILNSMHSSVFALDDEIRASDGACQFGLLPGEFEGPELFGRIHPFGELEADRPFAAILNRVHHIDRQSIW